MTGSHISQISSAVGKVAIYTLEQKALLNQRVGNIKPRDTISKKYLGYLLTQPEVQFFWGNKAGGSANQANISPSIIKSYKFLLPPLPEQKAIASVLSSLDDKIELLREQNKTLEALAQTLFKRWFSISASGVENTKLEDLIEINPREKIDFKKEYLFFEMKCLSENSMSMTEGIKKSVKSASNLRENDTLMAKITPCLENGKTGFVHDLGSEGIARGSTEFIVMRARNNCNPFFVYCLARDTKFRDYAIKSMTGTSGRQRVQIDLLKQYMIPYSNQLIDEFNDSCKPMFEKIKINSAQIKSLSTLRDTLLPKLMRGVVRVKYF